MNSGKRKRFTVTLAWQSIESAPTDGTDVITGVDCGGVWIVRSAWYRSAEDNGHDDIGWWSYRNSVTQERLEEHQEPTHWLCETNSPID